MRHSISSLLVICCAALAGCNEDEPTEPKPVMPPSPVCEKTDSLRVDAVTPISVVADWNQPIRLSAPVNTLCPQDAIEIVSDGSALFVMYTEDLLGEMTTAQMLARHNNTYRLARLAGPGEFDEPVFYDLGKGIIQSFNGEVSLSPDGTKVYFHSLRSTNLGYQQNPPIDDFLDIYVADLVNGVPGPARNLGAPVNSIYPDGEAAIHPDGVTLYFASRRPGGLGGDDMWRTVFDGDSWSDPVNLGTTLNSEEDDLQPAFTADGDTVYFASKRDTLIGMAIYRSVRNGSEWSEPELTIRGLAGEPSLTTDGRLLYFVHVLSDTSGSFDADVWYCTRSE